MGDCTMGDRERLEEIEAYYKEVGNIVEAEWIWLIETLKKCMDRCCEHDFEDGGLYDE